MSLVFYLQGHCHTLGLFRVSPMLFSKSFIVLPFFFRTVNHSELIFVKGVSSVSSIIFCMWMSSCSSSVCEKDYHSSILLPLVLGQRALDCIYGGLFLGSLFYWSICLLSCEYYTILTTVALQ